MQEAPESRDARTPNRGKASAPFPFQSGLKDKPGLRNRNENGSCQSQKKMLGLVYRKQTVPQWRERPIRRDEDGREADKEDGSTPARNPSETASVYFEPTQKQPCCKTDNNERHR